MYIIEKIKFTRKLPNIVIYSCYVISIVLCIPLLPSDEILSGMISLTSFFILGYSLAIHAGASSNYNRRVFTIIFIQGFFARVFVGLLFYYMLIKIYGDPFCRFDGFVRDNGYYNQLAIDSIYFIKNADYIGLMQLIEATGSQYAGFGVIVGCLYLIFGKFKIVVVMFNAMIGGLTGLYTYRIALKLYNIHTAYLAALLTNFFPLLLCYSAFLLKETIVTFEIILLVWLIISIREDYFKKIVLISSFAVLLIFLRRQMFFILLGCVLLHHVINVKKIGVKEICFYIVFVLSVGYILTFTPYGFMGKKSFINLPYEAAINDNVYNMLSKSPNSVIFKIYFLPQPVRLLAGTIFAWIMPFPPWRGWDEFYRASLMPGATIWLFVIPFVFSGMWYTFREKILSAVLPAILINILPIIIGYVGFGNFYRYRMQVTPLMLVFAAAGYKYYRKKDMFIFVLYFCLALTGTLFYIRLKYY